MPSESIVDDFQDVASNVNMTSFLAHVSYFSSLGTRVTGYRGCEQASEYIRDKFIEYGLSQVSYHYYNVAVPIDYGAYVEVPSDNISIEAHSIWPNGVQGSRADVTGRLIYARDGSWDGFDGRIIDGSVVLLDFNSRDNWLRVAELGAKAVIFMEPEDTNSVEAQLKKLSYAPFDFPRVYVEREGADLLLDLVSNGAEPIVRVVSDIRYEKRLARNVIGFVQGKDQDPEISSQVMVLIAHYDSYSVVPTLAPGASEAFGAAALLELAKYYAQNPTPRTLMFLAVSGHGETSAGAKSFLGDIVWFDKNVTLAEKFVSAIEVDITAESNMTAFFFSFLGSEMLSSWYAGYYRNYVANVSQLWNQLYGRSDIYKIEGWPGMLPVMLSPISIPSDGELFGRCGVFTTIQATGHSWYQYRGTPVDLVDKYKLSNLKPQLQVLFCNVYNLARLLSKKPLQTFSVSFARSPKGVTAVQGGGFGLLVGQVVEYNVTSGWYRSVPNSIVVIRATSAGGEIYVTFSDENGTFVYPGALPVARWGYPYLVEAYTFDPTSGSIVCGPDFGRYISSYVNRIEIPVEGYVGTLDNPRPFVVFRGGSLVLHDITATEQLLPALGFYSIEVRFTPGSITTSVSVNDIRTHAPPDHYSYVVEGSLAVIFAAPSIPIEVIIRNEPLPTPMVILTNASEVQPEGSGIQVAAGEQLRLANSPMRFATDLSLLNTARLSDAHEKNLNTGAEDYNDESLNSMLSASSALTQGRISTFYSEVVKSWSLSRKVYQLTRDSIDAATSTAVFVYALLIPFAIMLEELLFSFDDNLKRLSAIALLLVAFLVVLVMFHPGFQIASSIYVSLLGLTMITFIAPVAFVLISDAAKFLSEVRVKLIGEHYAGISRSSAALMSFDIGISQMRKRRFRTGLTLVSLVIITASFVMFTSVYPYTMVKEFPKTGRAYYQGLFLRDLKYSSLNYWLPDALKSSLDSSNIIVCPRAVLYPSSSYIRDGFKVFSFREGQAVEGRAYAIYGLTSEEGDIAGWSNALANGEWLPSGSLYVAVISDELANGLGVVVGDVVSLEGLTLRVVGILNTTRADSIFDLDQNKATPRDLRIITGIGFLRVADLVFVPYDLAVDLGANTCAIVIGFKEAGGIPDTAIALAKQTTLQIYASQETGQEVRTSQYSIAKGVQSYGFSTFVLPAAILGLSVLNLVLAVVFERSKDIGVLGAVGLSPLHIAGMFLGEIVSYAVVSATIGYTAGIILLQVLIRVPGALPAGFFPNYSSMFALLTVGLIISMVVLPSIYPLYKAAKMVTPSLERKFAIHTKPVGNRWEIPLPFVFVSEAEARGVLNFLREYFSTYTAEGAGVPFATKQISYGEDARGKVKSLSVTLHIAPFPAGINQRTVISTKFDEKDRRWTSELEIVRMTGEANKWQKSNYAIVDAVRKQFLQWRSLPPQGKNRYEVEAK
jgi:ABC-type antimicrobial peptide transport system permease subunit